MAAAPYPVDTKAKGWRFELDYEQIEQSSTWALAGPEGRPWLLMMWMTAWRQVPCGSMPADEEVIAALIGMAPKSWAKHRKALMRGWTLADDGRLYHATVSARVLEMLDYRKKSAERVAKFKAAKREQHGGNALPTGEQRDSNDTGTGTGTLEDRVGVPTPSSASGFVATPAAAVCIALKAAGIANCNSSHPGLHALLAAGATPDEFVSMAKAAIGKGDAFAYVLGAVEGQRKRAAATAGVIHHGPIRVVNKQAAIEAENQRAADEWLAQQGVA